MRFDLIMVTVCLCLVLIWFVVFDKGEANDDYPSSLPSTILNLDNNKKIKNLLLFDKSLQFLKNYLDLSFQLKSIHNITSNEFSETKYIRQQVMLQSMYC